MRRKPEDLQRIINNIPGKDYSHHFWLNLSDWELSSQMIQILINRLMRRNHPIPLSIELNPKMNQEDMASLFKAVCAINALEELEENLKTEKSIHLSFRLYTKNPHGEGQIPDPNYSNYIIFIAEQLKHSKELPQHLCISLSELSDEVLNRLVEALNFGNLPKNLTIDYFFQERTDGEKKVEFLVNILKSGKCPENLTLRLQESDFNDDHLKLLTEALPFAAKGLKLVLYDTCIGEEGIKFLATILSEQPCPQRLALDVAPDNYGKKATPYLLEALKSGKCSEGFALICERSTKAAIDVKLAEALLSNCPENCSISLYGNGDNLTTLVQALAHCRTGFCFSLKDMASEPTSEQVKFICQALMLGNICSLTLSELNLTDDKAVEYIAQALESNKLPLNFNLDLSKNFISSTGIKKIAAALKYAPKGFSLDLRDNPIGQEGLEAIVNQLAVAPQNFSLKLDSAHLRLGMKPFFTALASGHCPSGLTIDIQQETAFSPEFEKLERRISQAIAVNLIATLSSGKCQPNFKFFFHAEYCNETIQQRLMAAWQVYHNLQLAKTETLEMCFREVNKSSYCFPVELRDMIHRHAGLYGFFQPKRSLVADIDDVSNEGKQTNEPANKKMRYA
jgi:hypothetical protein